ESILASPVSGAPQFGFAVAPLASGLAAGAPFESDGRGAVHVFQGATPSGSLADPDAAPGDQFGFSLAVLDDAVVVGAPLHGERDTGLVRLFDAMSGALRRTFRKPVPMIGDFFGAAVAAEGGGVLVGAPFDGTASADAGAAYLFAADTAELTHTFAA